jgi:cytochrome c oxidase cbb3-type subunit 3
MSNQSNNQEHESPIKEHSFDGIQEYDKKLPNWWLWTLYGAVVFSVFYWSWSHLSGLKLSADEQLQVEMAALQDTGTGEEAKELNDSELWEMSRNGRIVGEGQKIFTSTCASCHGAELQGGIGLNLADNEWKNGQNPTDLVNVVMYGVLENGMPAWGSVLGERRVHDVVAYVLSKHNPPAE